MINYTRQLFLIFLYAVISPLITAAQGSDLILDTQAKVDAFDPSGLSSRALVISGADITNLDRLANTTKLTQLYITNNPNLTSIAGLSNLLTIGELVIANNSVLVSIDALAGVSNARGINIYGNAKLTHLPTFNNLTTINGNLYIKDNPELSAVELGSVENISLRLSLIGNPKLLNLAGFNSLKNLQSLLIQDMAITTIDGFSSLTAIPQFIVVSNPNLVSLTGFATVQRVGTFSINDNPKLQSVGGFSMLNDMITPPGAGSSRFIYVYGNPMLTSMDAFSNIQTLDNLVIENNAALKNVNSFRGLQRLPGRLNFRIDNNPSLENLDGFSNLDEVATTDSDFARISISDNPALTRPCGIFPFINALNNNHPGTFDSPIAFITGNNGFTIEQLKACGQVQPPYTTPLVRLSLDETAGIAPVNSGSATATFTRSANIPTSSTNGPSQDATAKSFDFGTSPGNYFVQSTTPIQQLRNLSDFTITGWVNAKSATTGSGGNRIVSWINNGGDGVDLVFESNGQLRLSVDGWPDHSPAFSSSGKITINSSGASDNWVFFAVTYSSGSGNVQYYFGSNSQYLSRDISSTLSAGAVGNNIGKLAIGAFNDATRNAGTYDRMFRGAIDDIRIFGTALNYENIWAVQFENRDRIAPSKPSLIVSTKTATSVTLQWATPSDNVGISRYVIIAKDLGDQTRVGANIGQVNTINFSDLRTGSTQRIYLEAWDQSQNASPKDSIDVTLENLPSTDGSLVHLDFNDMGLIYQNRGSASATFTRTTTMPLTTTNTPVLVGGANAIDYGVSPANYYVTSSTPVDALKNLSAFTITGWVNARSNVTGSGGNRIISWINNGGDGVDLVYRNNGSLQLGVDQWPDISPAFSSANKIPANGSAPNSNWIFFAVSYQSNGQVQFYFGSNSVDASLDVARTYSGRGATGSNIGNLAVGVFNESTRNPSTYDRMFKGLIDDVRIYNSVLSPANIVTVQRGTLTVDVTPPNAPTNAYNSAKTQTTAAISWTEATDNVGVTGYQIFNGASLVEEVGVVTSYTVIGLTPSTTYQFKVKAKDARGNISAFSNIVTVTTDPPSSQPPLVLLRFNEQNDITPNPTPVQEGSASAAFVRNGTAFSTNAPTAMGGNASYDFGSVAANKYVESTAPINDLKNMSEFTLTGWVNSKSNVAGSGGNRIISWINNGGDGVDLVYKSNGSLQLGVDQWPDHSPAISSANKVTTDASAASSNWVFFAATYKSTGQVQFYFGTNTTEATLDVTRTYPGRGLTGSNTGKFAVGAFNDATRNAWTYDRMFKGLIDNIQVYGKVLTESEIRIAQHGTPASSAKQKDMSVAREISIEDASDEPTQLFQNFPNPFNGETTINMYIRHDVKAAWISVYDVSGRSLREIEVKERGKTRVQIQRGDLNPGMYFYSLRVDGGIQGTKRMALTQ